MNRELRNNEPSEDLRNQVFAHSIVQQKVNNGFIAKIIVDLS